MHESIHKILLKIAPFTDEELALFCSILNLRHLKRREYLYQPGQICHCVAFIEQGSLRYFTLVDGTEQTGQFFFENSWYTDYESFLSTQPTEQYIQALEPTTAWLLPKTALYELYNLYPKFERFGRIMAENAYLGSRKSKEMLQNLVPEARYRWLIEERPKVIERVSLKYIASYLGIQPESLSRIRKRLYESR
jgi:CRP/FNR family transcriptional regulator, anaerobic regulatory protein